MSNTETERKTERVSTFLFPSDLKRLEKRAAELHLDVPAYVRQLILSVLESR